MVVVSVIVAGGLGVDANRDRQHVRGAAAARGRRGSSTCRRSHRPGRRRRAGRCRPCPATTETPSTTNPPPRRLAVQPSGTPVSERATFAWRVEVTVRSKLTLLPGATATAGKRRRDLQAVVRGTDRRREDRQDEGRDDERGRGWGTPRDTPAQGVPPRMVRRHSRLRRRRICQSRRRRYNPDTIQASFGNLNPWRRRARRSIGRACEGSVRRPRILPW